ncbi:MAG: CoA transferase [Acidimicrobiales bacterium]|nr:CoA transferase [Acidimicrobiales bacterium]MDG1876697.1 CoA transferase [Acidimicrobiales bacterium]
MTSPAPFAGVHVLDETDIRGALCGRILADFGATVHRPVHADDDGGPADRFRNARKIQPPAAEVHFADYDIWIENAGPTAPIDRDVIAAEHPTLIHVSLSDFGLTGERAGWHLEPLPALAASGALWATGFPHLPPTALPGFAAHDCASVHGAMGAAAALLDRHRTGLGQIVEISAQEAALTGLVPWPISVPDYLSVNPFLPAEGTRNAEGLYFVLEAADGFVRTVITTNRDWDHLLEVMGHPNELASEEWRTIAHRAMNMDLIRSVAKREFANRPRADVFAHAMHANAPLGFVQTPLEFARHEQCLERGFFVDDMPVAPLKFSATPTPPLGEIPDVSRPSIPERNDQPLPQLLAGTRVLEFGVAAVVPELCWMLSEFGADVIKVESVGKMDTLRFVGMGEYNKAFAYNMESRGRRSITVDLTTEEGQRIAKELCLRADIVAENNRGGVMARLGLDWDDLKNEKPALIYAASQGYGRGGPMGEMKAYGPLNSAFSGVHLLWSHPDGPYPSGTSLNHPDHIAGKMLATAVLAAIGHRDRTGEGQMIDMAQTEVAVYQLGDVYLEGLETGIEPINLANRHRHQAPHNVYPAAGEDAWIAIAVPDDETWARFADVLGVDRLEWATTKGRLADVAELDELVTAWTCKRDSDEATELLQAAGVSGMTVMGPLQQAADPHLISRNFVDELVHEEFGFEHHVANPTRMSRTELRTAPSAPCLGAHTRDILHDWLNLDEAEIGQLEASGALT